MIAKTNFLVKIGITVILNLVLIATILAAFSKATDKKSPGELSLVHAAFERDCQKCHDQNNEVTPTKCLNCHRELAKRIKAKKGYHSDKDEECSACHSEHQGKDEKLFDLDPADFDHSETGYTLTGMHKKVSKCESCHFTHNSYKRQKSKSYLLKSSHCNACHQSPHLGIKGSCNDCHQTNSWDVDIW